ncbi:MAG: hypothetical protein EOO43_10955 [Flavobacterium sp.]|nr:MAG: hypothetical protein EOO43_10955 [Flavobacterium sp.]
MVNTKNIKYFSFQNDELLNHTELEQFANDHSLARSKTISKALANHLVVVKENMYVFDKYTNLLYLVDVNSFEKYIAMMSQKFILESYDASDYHNNKHFLKNTYEMCRMPIQAYEDFSMDILNIITDDTLVVVNVGEGQYRKVKSRRVEDIKTMMDSDTEEEDDEEDEDEEEDEEEDMKINVKSFRKMINKK